MNGKREKNGKIRVCSYYYAYIASNKLHGQYLKAVYVSTHTDCFLRVFFPVPNKMKLKMESLLKLYVQTRHIHTAQ